MRLLLEAVVVGILMAGSGAADELSGPTQGERPRFELFQRVETARLTIGPPALQLQHRFRLELEGARAQAEDWLHDAGFSLLEERDGDGRNSYSVISAVLVADWPAVRVRARIGGPQLSAGLQVRRQTPAIGITLPLKAYNVELEGLQEKNLGYLLMGSLRWSDKTQRIEYGVSVPLAFKGGPTLGVLLQVRIRFDQ